MNEYTCVPSVGKLEAGHSLATQAHCISEPQVGLESLLKTNKQIVGKMESGRGKELDVIVNLWLPHASAVMSMITRMLVYTHKQTHVYS